MNYYLDKRKYKIEFCPDSEGMDIKKKKQSYTSIAKDCGHQDRAISPLVLGTRQNRSSYDSGLRKLTCL